MYKRQIPAASGRWRAMRPATVSPLSISSSSATGSRPTPTATTTCRRRSLTRPLPSIWRPTSCSPAKNCKFYDKTNPGRCLTALPGFAIMSIERALRQAVGPSSRFTVFENRHRAGWRFLLFHANGECQSKQVECQSNWHVLTSFRK